MDVIQCDTCKIVFKTRAILRRHYQSKRHLKLAGTHTHVHVDAVYSCTCGKVYACRQSLHVHRKKCNVYCCNRRDDIIHETDEEKQRMKQKIEDLEHAHKLHEEERQELRNQISLLLEKFSEQPHGGSTIHNTQIEHQTNQQTIENMTININAFGNENLDYITDKVIVKCIGRIYNSIPVLIEKIHFDPKHPENHNIKITNRKLPYASVMTEDNKWKTMDKQHAIESMMDKSYGMLEMSYEGNKDELRPQVQKNFETFQDNYNNQDRKTMKNLKKNVEIAILNGCS